MTKARKFKKEYAAELMKIADGDLDSARVLRAGKVGRPENIFFLAEQAIEKALKAVLCASGLPVPLVHELAVIVDRFPEKIEVPRAEEMVDLTQFATIRRYEEGRSQFSNEELDGVLTLASETLQWARDCIRK